MRLARTLLTLPFAWAAALGLACPAMAAKGELIDITWDADGGFARSVQVAPKRFVEVCGKLSAGMAVGWRFEAGTPLDFNIHFHEGKSVRYPERQAGIAKAAGTLKAPGDQDYCWMWTNDTATEATLSFTLRKP